MINLADVAETLLEDSSETVKDCVTLERNQFVHPQDQPLFKVICGAYPTTQSKCSPKPHSVKRLDVRRKVHILLLQISLSWVLLLPGEVIIPLGHLLLEGPLNWSAVLSQTLSTEELCRAWWKENNFCHCSCQILIQLWSSGELVKRRTGSNIHNSTEFMLMYSLLPFG